MSITGALLERERQFARAFAPAALHGIRLDPEQVEKLIAEHEVSREAARTAVEALTDGQVTNPKSAPQVGPYLASTGRYELPASVKTGKPGAGKGALAPYAHQGDELAKQILQYRADDTALGLLLYPRRALCQRGDGRVRTSILTVSANTGRTSSRNENLQQVSRQGGMRACHVTELAREWFERFGLPFPDKATETRGISADFSSVEIRVGAALSGDDSMKHLIAMLDEHPEKKREYDFHWRTAITCYGPDATKENRYNSKRINFAKMYGSGKESAARQVGIPLPEVSRAFDAFDAVAPQYGRWDRQMRDAARRGMKSFPTYSGRDIWLTGKGEHAVGNAAIQGTAREFLVDAVLKWRQGPWGNCLLIPVHDELVVWDVPAHQAEDAIAYLVSCMETELLGVKIKAEASEPWTAWPDAS